MTGPTGNSEFCFPSTSKKLTRSIRTGHLLGFVYTDAVSNRNGFMSWKPHRERHGFYEFTYPTVKSNRLCQDDLILRPLSFVNWIWERVKSTYPCLPAILFFLSWLRLQKKKNDAVDVLMDRR